MGNKRCNVQLFLNGTAIFKSELKVVEVPPILQPEIPSSENVSDDMVSQKLGKTEFRFASEIVHIAYIKCYSVCSEWSGGLQRGGGAGDADREVRPGPPPGADRDRKHHSLHLQPDAVSARQRFRTHTGLREGPEGYRSE